MKSWILCKFTIGNRIVSEPAASSQNVCDEKINFLIGKEQQTKRFAIRVSRKGTHNYSSTELARIVAGAVFDEWPDIKVDLNSPELEIFVQIINNMSVIYLKHS